MPLDASCPKCNHVFPVTEARSTIGLICPACEIDLTAEFRKRATPVPGQHPYELFVSEGRLVGTPPPLAGKKPHSLDDEDEMRGGGSGMGVVVFAALFALVLALGGLGTTGYFLFSNLDTSDATVNNLSTNTGTKGGTKGGGQVPGGGFIPGGGTPGGGTPGGGRPKGGGITGTIDPGVPIPPPQFPQPPRDEFELKPVAGPVQAITPPPIDLTKPVTVPLPGRAGAVTVGGNGRYLVFHIPDRGQLVVFDASKGELVASESADKGDVFLAGGQTRLVMMAPGNVLRVYDLPTLKKRYDASGPPLPHYASSIAMGSATNGPLIACNPFGEVILMNIDDGGATPVEGSKANIGGDLTVPVRAAANGKLFVRGGYGNGSKTVIATEWARKWKTVNSELTNGYPAADGRHLLGFGMITLDSGRMVGNRAGGKDNGVWYVPAVSGNQFLRLSETREGTGAFAKQLFSISIHRSYLGPEREKAPSLGVLPETDGLIQFFFGSTLPLDQHLFLIPEAKVLAVLPATKDKLVLRKVDVR